MGSVARVTLNADAYLTCLTHALSNETEEVMGLCIGEMIEQISGCEINIYAVMLLRRIDKRKDRVEISVEQLSNASTVAENLANKTNRPLRIVGWYHSHPHITVWPSHVDVQTQAMYQMMDQTFIGLIFSCFNENKANLQQTIEMTCFQSAKHSPEWESQPQYDRIEVPVFISRKQTLCEANLKTLTDLTKILVQEENDSYNAATETCGTNIMTRIHNASVHSQSLCNITESITSPLLHILHSTNQWHKEKLKKVNAHNEKLKLEIEKLEKEIGSSTITESSST